MHVALVIREVTRLRTGRQPSRGAKVLEDRPPRQPSWDRLIPISQCRSRDTTVSSLSCASKTSGRSRDLSALHREVEVGNREVLQIRAVLSDVMKDSRCREVLVFVPLYRDIEQVRHHTKSPAETTNPAPVEFQSTRDRAVTRYPQLSRIRTPERCSITRHRQPEKDRYSGDNGADHNHLLAPPRRAAEEARTGHNREQRRRGCARLRRAGLAERKSEARQLRSLKGPCEGQGLVVSAAPNHRGRVHEDERAGRRAGSRAPDELLITRGESNGGVTLRVGQSPWIRGRPIANQDALVTLMSSLCDHGKMCPWISGSSSAHDTADDPSTLLRLRSETEIMRRSSRSGYCGTHHPAAVRAAPSTEFGDFSMAPELMDTCPDAPSRRATSHERCAAPRIVLETDDSTDSGRTVPASSSLAVRVCSCMAYAHSELQECA
ncbi:hypothetical protein C8Q74DRAFT_1222471 [Fomes fomentarius]|nr:hypothetical protein C8Q74DRAFT_1222471 [Fomes fomentarius]